MYEIKWYLSPFTSLNKLFITSEDISSILNSNEGTYIQHNVFYVS